MDNNLQKYMAFVTTVETGSFTRAAERLHYAQSSVSKMIADLEQEWGMVLLRRDRSGVHLTTAGEQILPYARQLLADYHRLEAYVDAMGGIRTGTLRIGSFSSVAIHWLPEICAQFQKDYPGIEYEILMGDYAEVERWIAEGRVDCGFLRLPTRPEYDTISLKKDEYMVVLPQGHPLAAHTSIDNTLLDGEPFMLLEHGGRTEVSELLERDGVHPQIRFTTWEDYAIMAMVEKGFGIAVLPELILRRIPYRLEIRPLTKPFYREIGLAVKSEREMTPVMRKFLEYLRYRE